MIKILKQIEIDLVIGGCSCFCRGQPAEVSGLVAWCCLAMLSGGVGIVMPHGFMAAGDNTKDVNNPVIGTPIPLGDVPSSEICYTLCVQRGLVLHSCP